MICGHSTGSMTGCRPLCDRRATHALTSTYVGSSGIPSEIRRLRCAEHIRPTVNAAWPEVLTLSELRSDGDQHGNE